MSYCTLEEAWNLSDCEENENDYQNFEQIDKNYFDTPVENSKELDFQNHEIEITRNRNKDKVIRTENNFDKYNEMEQKNLKNMRGNHVSNEISPNNLNNSSYHFLNNDLEDNNINSNEQDIYENNQSNYVLSEEYENFTDQVNDNKKDSSNNTSEIMID